MAFFTSAITILQTLVVALGAALRCGVSSTCLRVMGMITVRHVRN